MQGPSSCTAGESDNDMIPGDNNPSSSWQVCTAKRPCTVVSKLHVNAFKALPGPPPLLGSLIASRPMGGT